MSHKIIKPEGIELIEYLNNGYAICNRCGAVMRQTEDPKTGCGISRVDGRNARYGTRRYSSSRM